MEPIRYFNRQTGSLETEQIYGERWLRLAYDHPCGTILRPLIKRHFFSRWYGRRMARPASRKLVAPFIEEFGLDCADFADSPESFRSFNEFFVRKLKPSARPLDPDRDNLIFPCDGRHFAFPDVSKIRSVFVKGQRFDLPALLGSAALADRYATGALVLSRLCPVDYHRYHFPADGTPSAPRLLNGPLYSVSPLALRRKLAYLWENKRVLTELTTRNFGTILTLEIGATNVGSIQQTFTPGRAVERGEEKGYFAFGGSSIITLLEPGQAKLADDLVANSRQQIELFALFGSHLASKT